jgi:hypothetical protein
MLKAVVSGSFHHHMAAITSAVHELASLSVRVLSPADPRVVAAKGEFLFVASDHVRSVRLVQDRHLDCIGAADFLWLVCPDGYVGKSASMEIGYAAGAGVPILATRAPGDLTLREYVTIVRSFSDAIDLIRAKPRMTSPDGILIDPRASVEEAHAILERVEAALTHPSGSEDPARRVYADLAKLRTLAVAAVLQ